MNPYYQRAFDKIHSLDLDHTMFHGWGVDADPAHRPVSLWTGGIAVSVFSSKNYRVLEHTKLGKLFDNFVMHPDSKVQYPIWYLFSEGFIASDILYRQVKAGNDPIVLNYHFRADDSEAIAQLVEIPTALARSAINAEGVKGKKVIINMVPLINDEEEKIKAFTKPIPLEVDIRNFKDQLKKGVSPLYTALELIHQLEKKVAKAGTSEEGKLIKKFCDANAYAINQHIKSVSP